MEIGKSRLAVATKRLSLSIVVLSVVVGLWSPSVGATSSPSAQPTSSAGPTAVLLSGGIRPYSASGSNGAVTINVTGTGLHVDSWVMTFTLPTSMCTYGAFWEAGKVVATGPELCGKAGNVYYARWDNQTFRTTTQICNTGLSVPGKPCETVHP